MDRAEAIYRLRVMVVEADTKADIQALDLAIEALKDDTHSPMWVEMATGTRELSLEEWQEIDRAIQGDAESATTTDCNYTCSDCKHQDRTYEQEPCHSCFNNDGAGYEPDTDCISRADTIKAICAKCTQEGYDECREDCTEVAVVKGMPSVSEEEVDYCNNCPYLPWGKDCISRQQAIEAVEEQYFGGTVADINPSWRKLHNILESLPPVTPTERTGEWVKVSGYVTPGGDPVWECSECGKGRHVYGIEASSYQRDVSNQQWVACPNCGSRMRGKHNDE